MVNNIIKAEDIILITGSSGFIGTQVVKILLEYGYVNLKCLVRPSSNTRELEGVIAEYDKASVEIISGNLLSYEDCIKISKNVSVVYHLAAGRGEKSFPDAYINSVVTARNILKALAASANLKRFVNVSSFTVYAPNNIPHNCMLDEMCDVEPQPNLRGEAYCYAKVKQEELVKEYANIYNIPYVILRPGVVYGPGNKGLSGRVGINIFGIFLHLGGSNVIPLSYVDNCAEAIVLSGIKKGIDGEIFNVVDDNLPKSKFILKMYKKHVRDFKSIYIPHPLSYFLCYLWEKYSYWSEGQLPLTFNRKTWINAWKGHYYSNIKLKNLLGWKPRVEFEEAMRRFLEYQVQE